MAHIIQTFTVLLILKPSPHKPVKLLGFRSELQELRAALILPVEAAQGPPNPKVTLLAWEVLELQISSSWESIVGKPIIIHGHHSVLVLIPLSTTGHRTSGQGNLQPDPKQPLSQFSGYFHLCPSRGSEALQWRRAPQHQDVHCSAPHPASYNHTDSHTMR